MNGVNNLTAIIADYTALMQGTRGLVTQGMSMLSSLALFIIGCIGAAGILPGSTMGWLVIGLGSGSFLLQLAGGRLQERKGALLVVAVITLVFIILAALGVAGILSGAQVGWGVVGTCLVPAGVACVATCGALCCVGLQAVWAKA
jgi:hypothetical protein